MSDEMADDLSSAAEDLADDLRDLRDLAPRQRGEPLCWLTSRSRGLLLSYFNHPGSPVVVVSVWIITGAGERFPVKDGVFEVPLSGLPALARGVADALRRCSLRVADRLHVRRAERQVGAR